MAAAHDLLVLALAGERPIHGYDVRRYLDGSYLAHCTSLSTPQIYAVFRRLERKGLVGSHEERTGAAPPRIVYRVTAAGKKALAASLASPRLVSQRVLFDVDTVLSAMAHCGSVTTEDALSVVRGRLNAVREQLAACRGAWEQTCSRDRAPELARVIFDHRSGFLSEEIRWLKRLERAVRQKGWGNFATLPPAARASRRKGGT